MLRKIKKYNGFSLMETIIALFIFSIIITASVSVFASIFNLRKNTRKVQSNMETARTALDLMAKNIRMSNELESNASNVLTMHNTSQDKCIRYRFLGSAIEIAETAYASPCSTAPYVGTLITENNVTAGYFIIVETDATSSPKKIGRATINMLIGDKRMQTTVSFRDYNGIVN